MAFLADGGPLGMLAAGIQFSHFGIGPDPKTWTVYQYQLHQYTLHLDQSSCVILLQRPDSPAVEVCDKSAMTMGVCLCLHAILETEC